MAKGGDLPFVTVRLTEDGTVGDSTVHAPPGAGISHEQVVEAAIDYLQSWLAARPGAPEWSHGLLVSGRSTPVDRAFRRMLYRWRNR